MVVYFQFSFCLTFPEETEHFRYGIHSTLIEETPLKDIKYEIVWKQYIVCITLERNIDLTILRRFCEICWDKICDDDITKCYIDNTWVKQRMVCWVLWFNATKKKQHCLCWFGIQDRKITMMDPVWYYNTA